MRGGGRSDFIRYYRELELKPGSEWEQARRQFKLLSQRWHPDRHHHNPDEKLRAERKQQAINEAMRAISDYYRANGNMPLRPRVKPGSRPIDIPGCAAGDHTPDMDSVLQKEGGSSGAWFWFVLLLFVVSALWLLLPGQTRYPVPEPGIRPDTQDLQAGLYREGAELPDNKKKPPPETVSPALSGSEEFIRIGSSPEDVIRIQGEPLFKNGARWDFGPSYIEFRYNRVSGWHNSPMRPLRVKE